MRIVAFKFMASYTRGAEIFQKSRGNPKILGARKVASSNFLAEDLKILCATV
jgi:hypothetical protein